MWPGAQPAAASDSLVSEPVGAIDGKVTAPAASVSVSRRRDMAVVLAVPSPPLHPFGYGHSSITVDDLLARQ